jgi:hypothetical protein
MTRVRLMRLTNQGLGAVDAAFLDGTPQRLPDDPSFAVPLRDPGVLSRASVSVDVPGEHPLGPEDDARVAVIVHRALPIRRAIATDDRFWAWLAACECAPLLRRRWRGSDRSPNRQRFVGTVTDNGLARLWWAAELTADRGGIDESSLAALLASQYRTDRLLSMATLRHAPVLKGFLDAIGDDIRWQVLNAVCQRVGVLSTTYAVPAMTREEARAFVSRVYESVVSEGAFAPGPEDEG